MSNGTPQLVDVCPNSWASAPTNPRADSAHRMQMQTPLFVDRPPATAYTVQHARAAGAIAGQKATDKAEGLAPGFSASAQAAILRYLQAHGSTSGEDLTQVLVSSGIRPPDMRAFGHPFQALHRAKRIVCLRSDLPRRMGHGSSGGKLWGLA